MGVWCDTVMGTRGITLFIMKGFCGSLKVGSAYSNERTTKVLSFDYLQDVSELLMKSLVKETSLD